MTDEEVTKAIDRYKTRLIKEIKAMPFTCDCIIENGKKRTVNRRVKERDIINLIKRTEVFVYGE